MYSARKKAKIKESEIILAVKKIQTWWRKCFSRKRFLQQRSAVVIIQSYVRLYTQRKKFRNCKESILKVQALIRSRNKRQRYCEYKESAKRIQRHWRGVFALRSARKEYAERLFAVTRIQAWWRMHLQRRSFLQQKAAATRLQSIVRSHLQRKFYTRLKTCTVKLQSFIRSSCQRRRYCRHVESIKKIQRYWRLTLASRIAQRRRTNVYNAATRIQAWWRQCAARRSFLSLRVYTIHLQRCIRSYVCRKNYKMYREHVVKVQVLLRSRKERTRYTKCKDAALKIQTHVRHWLASEKLLKAGRNSAAKKIQAAWRTIRLTKAATKIQACYKGWRQRQHYKTRVKQIIQAQAIVRGQLIRCSLRRLKEHGSSPLIGHPADIVHALSNGESAVENAAERKPYDVLRRFIQTIMQRRWFLQLRKCTLTLQRRWRYLLQQRYDAATTIQRHFHGWQQRNSFHHKILAIKSIQACWRGHSARRRHGHLKHKLSDLLQRMQNTAAKVDNKMRLENRLTAALAELLSQKTVSGVLHTCATIDLATQHSKLCCERLLEAGAIPKLLQLIQTTNRSPPHQEVLKHALSILANLARYQEFATLVADAPASITTVADQLLRNDDEVLSKVIKLLRLICKVPRGLETVQKKTAVLRRLYTLSQALEKKVEVEARSLARLPSTASVAVRKSGEKKVNDAVAQHHSIVLLLQTVTGEDLLTRLKAVKRMSCIYQVPSSSRPSICRFPLQDCSNK